MTWHPQVGSLVEVCGEDGEYKNSFSTARVKKRGIGEIVVEYCEFVKDSGEPLSEAFFGKAENRLRPPLPQSLLRPSIRDYKVGEPCDVFHEDVWWWGIVREVSDDTLTITRTEQDGLDIPVLMPDAVRPGYEWVEGLWRRRVPRKATLAKLRILGPDQIDQLLQSLAREPHLRVDGTEALPSPTAAHQGGMANGSGMPRTQFQPMQQLHQPAQPRQPAQAQQLQPAAQQLQPAPQQYQPAPQQYQPAPQQYQQAAQQYQQAPQQYQQAPQQFQQAPAASTAMPMQLTQSALASIPPAMLANLSPEVLAQLPMILAAQQAARASAPEPQPERRSTREVKSRLVYVDGHSVLKSNMYDLESGEPSVFDRELAQNSAAASAPQAAAPQHGFPPEMASAVAAMMAQQQRVTGTLPAYMGQLAAMMNIGGLAGNVSLQPPQRPPMSAAMVAVHQARSAQEAAAKAYNPGNAARLAHNDQMRSEIAHRDAIRALYLKQHIDKLRPFVTPAVLAQIEQRSQRGPADYVLPEPVMEQPASIKGEMREYQVAGLQWLVKQYDHGVNAILADEMGLGKTLQTIAFLAYLTFDRKINGPHLVVVPLSVLPNWMSEFKRFCPDLRVARIHVNDEGERRRLRTEVLANPSSFDVAVTTYDMVNSIHFGDALKRTIMWRYVILDEGHRVKNEDALISQGMRAVSRQSVLMLTGTPVQNNLHELYALLNFMFPDVFASSEPFDRAFNLTQGHVDASALEAAHKLLRPFMLRRVKDEVECKLPPKSETRINCPLSEFQTFWYRRMLLRDCELLKAVEAGSGAPGTEDAPKRKGRWANRTSEDGRPAATGVGHWNKMMNLLMQLRKVCNHPYLFNVDAEPDFDGVTTGEDIVESSGKMQVLDRLLVKLKHNGHRVVLFSQFSRMLDILEDYLRMRGWRYKRLDGSTNRIQRMIDIQQFNKPNSDIFLYILCTRAGGLGVNLQTADTCILFDSDWNPQQDLQAMARVHRIGQTKPVHVYRLVSEGTVEERIQKRAESKLFLDKMVNRNSTQGGDELEKMDKNEVLSMLKFGADRIFKNDAGRTPTDEELDALIDRAPLMEEHERLQAIKNDPEGALAAAAAQAAGTSNQQQSVPIKRESTQAGTSAGAGPSSAGGAGGQLVAGAQHTVAAFDAEAPPISTFQWAGQDFKELRQQAQQASLKEMAAQFWANKKRVRKERLMKVDGYDVLRENNYSMQQGGISAAVAPAKGRSRRQVAGEDYIHCDFCQRCWDGGELLCCDFCPVSVHPSCIGMTPEEVASIKKWSCPHHSCATCGRTTAAAGGLLFRCEACEAAYCEDHLPDAYEILGECRHFQALGQIHPKQACFILCSPHCQKVRHDLAPTIDEMTERLSALLVAQLNERDQQAALEAQQAAAAAAKGGRSAAVEFGPPKRKRGRLNGYDPTPASIKAEAKGRGGGRGRGRGRGGASLGTDGEGVLAPPPPGGADASGFDPEDAGPGAVDSDAGAVDEEDEQEEEPEEEPSSSEPMSDGDDSDRPGKRAKGRGRGRGRGSRG